MNKGLLLLALVVLLGGEVFGQSNNKADVTNTYRYSGVPYWKVVHEQYGDGTAFQYLLAGQAFGQKWCGSALVYSLRDGSHPVDVQLTRRVSNDWDLTLAGTFGQRTTALVTADYHHGRVGYGLLMPTSDLHRSEVAVRYSLGENWMLFASASPSGVPKYGLNWHEGRDRIDLTIDGKGENIWGKWGHQLSPTWSFEVRSSYDTRHSGNRMIGIGILYCP